MNLSQADHLQLQRASETMLTPFEHTATIAYLKAVAAEVRPLLGAFASICGERSPSGEVAIASDEWSEPLLAEFSRWKLKDAGTERAVAAGIEVAMMRHVIGDAWDEYHNDPMVRQWYKPNQVLDAGAYMLHWPEDDSLITAEFHGREFGTPRFGDEGAWILSMLLPSLRAGTRLLHALGRERHRLAADMDALGVPVWVCERDGRIVHQSDAAGRLLAEDREANSVRREIPVVARAVSDMAPAAARGAAVRTGASATLLPPTGVHRMIHTSRHRYRLSAALATQSMHFGVSDVLVTASRITEEVSPLIQLGARYFLSPRELEVAALLARGAPNYAIADALGISPHTVRRHTERIFSKLGVSNRAQVAASLNGNTSTTVPARDV